MLIKWKIVIFEQTDGSAGEQTIHAYTDGRLPAEADIIKAYEDELRPNASIVQIVSITNEVNDPAYSGVFVLDSDTPSRGSRVSEMVEKSGYEVRRP